MASTAFAAPFPLLRNTQRSQRGREAYSKRRQPASLAKPPSRKPKPEQNTQDSNNSNNRALADQSTNPAQDWTAAQLSEKLAQAVRFDLILDDITRLTNFLQSFVKSKPSERSKRPKLSNASDTEPRSETTLARPTQSRLYQPKSAAAAKVAKSYTTARGAVDRALQALSIRAQNYVNAVAQVAGDAVCKVLSVGHETFPGLRLEKAKDAVTGALKEGWTPLSVFQWQLSGSSAEGLEERRRERIQQLKRLLRVSGMDSVLNATGSTLTEVGRAAEKLAPILFKGVSKVASRGIARASVPKSSVPSLLGKVVAHKRKEKTAGFDGADSSLHKPALDSISQTRCDSEAKGKSQDVLRESQQGVLAPVENANRAVAVATSTSHKAGSYAINNHETGNHTASSGVRPKTELSPSKVSAGEDGSGSQPREVEHTQLVRTGVMVLAAGAVASTAATVSVPTAVTCSALMVTSIALSGMKTVNTSGKSHESYKTRQSRAVQNLDDVLTKTQLLPHLGSKADTLLLAPAAQTRKQQVKAEFITANIPTSGTEDVRCADRSTIEASSYTVSGSQPTIMSLPVIGSLLHWLDTMAFRVEGLFSTILRRSGLHRRTGDRTEWELLRSFQHRSYPD